MTESDYDTTEKLTRTDTGYRYEIKCKRGTGTRDQDEVKAELRREDIPDATAIEHLRIDVETTMTELRAFQPDDVHEDNDD